MISHQDFAPVQPQHYPSMDWRDRKNLRNSYLRVQNGLCCYCYQPLTGPPSEQVQKSAINKRLFPKTMFDYPIHLHHDHNTGMSIGAVHARCNAYLWQHNGE